MSRTDMGVTMKPFLRIRVSQWSCIRRVHASRTGVRLVPHRSARSASERNSPGGSLAVISQSRRMRYTRSTSPSLLALARFGFVNSKSPKRIPKEYYRYRKLGASSSTCVIIEQATHQESLRMAISQRFAHPFATTTRAVLLCLAASASLAWTQAKPAPTLIPDRLPDSYQIYSLLMPGQVFTDMDSGQNQPWAISDTTINEDDMNPKLAPEATLQPPSDNPRAFHEAVTDYNQ